MAHSTNKVNSNLSRSPLALWVEHHERQLGLSIKGRFRGNSLHLLCEFLYISETCPSQQVICRHFQSAVKYEELNRLVPPGYPRIRHIWLYGRIHGAKKPEWTVPIHLHPTHQAGVAGAKSLSGLPEASPCEFSVASPSSPPPTATTAEQRYLHQDKLHQDKLHQDKLHQDKLHQDKLHQDKLHQDRQSIVQAPPDPEVLYAQAAQGNPKAIAYYLHDVLDELGVEADVRVKCQTNRPNTSKHRLWVTCQGAYSPAAALVGEPIARQLRELSLHNVEDALLQFQVKGEESPDWVLRIDLTPQDDMLRSWAEWGDVEAISRLVNQVLHPLDGQLIEATLKDITLHLICTSASTDRVLDAQPTKDTIASLLTRLNPQGLHSAVVYSQPIHATTPDWVEWIDVSATEPLDRTAPALELASNGDLDAIAFLIQRLLNPDLNTQLATGGVRVQVLLKRHLLHIMCDAPLCPEEEDVIPEIERLLRSLNSPGVEGLRLYGRRAGQRRPRWTHNIDFVKQPQMVPEPAPQFAATDAYVTELVTAPTEPIIRPDLTASDLWQRWQDWQQRLTQSVRRFLLRSQFVVPTSDSPELMLRSAPRHATVKTALVWTAVGALGLIQADLGLNHLSRLTVERPTMQPRGQITMQPSPEIANSADVQTDPAAAPSPDLSSAFDSFPFPSPQSDSAQGDFTQENLTQENLAQENQNTQAQGNFAQVSTAQETVLDSIEFNHSSDSEVFNSTGFTASEASFDEQEPQTVAPLESDAKSLSDSLTTALNSPYPSFNSEQLDFKLALYHQRVLDIGPPDVLILGSSRAMRGVDPAILEQSLTDLGYRDADVFNFGINGATAQVVELIVQQILQPEQLPKLIVWADGARAFNSGRDDRTYNGIVASEGYEQLLSGALVLPDLTDGQGGDVSGQVGHAPHQRISDLSQALAKSYQDLDEQLSDAFAVVSTSHPRRDRIKQVLQHGLTAWLPQPGESPALPSDLAHGNQTLSELDNPELVYPGSSLDSSGAPNSTPSGMASLDISTSFRSLENIDDDGFLPLQIRFDPTQYYQSYARVTGSYDRDYSNFRLQGAQGEALSTLLAVGQDYSIPIVFINMPLTEEYLDPVRLGHEQTFRQYMLNLALQQEHFIFRDLGGLWLDQTEHRSYFSDPSHLNQYGADEISRHISKDPMIPWDVTTR